jgi:hypothetical protein
MTRVSVVGILRLDFLRPFLSQSECEIFVWSDLRSENRQGRSRRIPDRRSGNISRNGTRMPRVKIMKDESPSTYLPKGLSRLSWLPLVDELRNCFFHENILANPHFQAVELAIVGFSA